MRATTSSIVQHCLASSLCLWLYGIIMESFDAITHHTYFYDHTQCDFAPRTDNGDGDLVINLFLTLKMCFLREKKSYR